MTKKKQTGQYHDRKEQKLTILCPKTKSAFTFQSTKRTNYNNMAKDEKLSITLKKHENSPNLEKK